MNCGCGCHDLNYDETLGNALEDAVAELTGAAASLSVLRNGGWEQWLRNILLIKLEAPQSWGLTEARHLDIQRIDLAIYCTLCGHPRFAVEIKINFTKQSPSEIKGRISEAICQLSNFAEHNIPTYIVYVLTHLSGEENSPVVARQNVEHIPGYKHFHIPVSHWPDRGFHLPHEHHRTSSHAVGDLCSAEVRAWLAEAAVAENPPNSRTLRWITPQDHRYQHWNRLPDHPGLKNKNKWILL